jgi:hypothetical protein
MALDGERRAWGWVAHLRDGGTTPWREWTGAGPHGGAYLPGAQQLELLRRLHLAGRPTPELVERVLGASAPGRGAADLELVGVADHSPFGPRPVDPADLPEDELTRVATSLVAEDLVAAGTPERRPARYVRPWRTRYRLVGDPWLADPARAALVARGRPPGGRGPVVLVLGTDLATMLTDAWTSRAFDDGCPPWREWLDPFTAGTRVPPRVDLERAAATWSRRVGRSHVRVVLDPAALPRLVGVRRSLPAPPRPAADAVELARRVAGVLGLLVLPDRRAELLRGTLLPRLLDAPGAPLAVPGEHAAWVADRAARMRDRLLRAGYPVHGDPDALLPRPDAPAAAAGGPSDAGVLALAVRLLLGPGRGEEAR